MWTSKTKIKLVHINPNVENSLRSRKVEWILRVKVSEVAWLSDNFELFKSNLCHSCYKIVLFTQFVSNKFCQSRSNQNFLCLPKWLEIWPTDALNFFDYRSHLVDWGWLEFTSTENTKKLVTKWVIISGPKLLAHLKAGPISHILYSLPFMKVFWKSWQLNLLEN